MNNTEIEQEFFTAFNIGKPVIRKWCYEGYYEDFSWESSEEDCAELLKYFDNSIDKLDDRIQQMKKEDYSFDVYTDSVSTEFGRLSGAYMIYPKITVEKLLKLICIYNEFQNDADSLFIPFQYKNIKNNLLEILTEEIRQDTKNKYFSNNVEKLKQQVQQLFKEK